MNMAKKSKSSIRGLIASVLIIALVGGLWLQKQNIFDWLRLYNYQAPSEISQLADTVTMTPRARRIFYVYHPLLGDRSQLADKCPDRSEQTIVLGCYVHNRQIYLFEVTDQRLQGVHEVTAAHEMLHAAYARLSTAKRSEVDNMIQAAYKLINDDRLTSTINSYNAIDPSIVPNELHSILATEVRNLPAGLENYYGQYFTNRGHVVNLSEGYEQEFTRRRASIAESDKKLQSLKAQIETNQSDIDELNNQLSQLRADLQRAQARGDTEEYNAGVPGYNGQVREYNSLVVTTQGLIDEYNRLVQERNAIALEEQQLFRALEGRPETIETR